MFFLYTIGPVFFQFELLRSMVNILPMGKCVDIPLYPKFLRWFSAAFMRCGVTLVRLRGGFLVFFRFWFRFTVFCIP